MKHTTTRRRFITTTGAALAAPGIIGAGCAQQQQAAAPEREYWEPQLTDNLYGPDERSMLWLAQLGCTHVCLQDDNKSVDWDGKGYWTPADIKRFQDICAQYGLSVASLLLPKRWYLKNNTGEPGRDQEIELMIKSIAAAGEAGVPVLEWRPTWNDFYWDERVGYAMIPGRGGSRYQSFDLDRIKDLPDFDEFPPTTREEMWERFIYIGKPIIEAAEKANVALSCHPNDPPIPIMRGQPRVMVSMDDVRRFLKEIPSPANGITFCQGTFTEMGEDIFACIHELGDRIKHVHLRNVSGTIPKYNETFIDDGDIDMVEAMKAYRDIDYRRTMVADHSPGVEGGGMVGRTFSIGYMRALVQAVNKMA